MRISNVAIIFLFGASFLSGCSVQTASTKNIFKSENDNKKHDPVDNSLNAILLADPKNYKAHFLAALAYDKKSNHSRKYRDLARVGYKLSNRYNPRFGNALYHLGLLDIEDAEFNSAIKNFLLAAKNENNRPEFYYSLSYAALSANDIFLAKMSFDKATKIAPPKKQYEIALGVMLSKIFEQESRHVDYLNKFRNKFSDEAFKKIEIDLEKITRLTLPTKIKLTNSFYKNLYTSIDDVMSYEKFDNRIPAEALAEIQKIAQINRFITGDAEVVPSAKLPEKSGKNVKKDENAPEKQKAKNSVGDKNKPKKMAVVDVIIVQNDASSSTISGTNLLDLLSLNFQGKIVSGDWARSTQWRSSPSDTLSRTLGSSMQLEIPSINYSLNIANQQRTTNRLTARPSVLVTEGAESKIFAGAELTIVTDGQLNSQSITKKVGLSLSVTPTFNDDGTVELQVKTEQSDVSPISGGNFRQSLQTTSNQASVNAILKSGETIMIAGGTGARSNGNVSQTPVLHNIPVMGKLFDKQVSSQSQTSLIVFLTLRKHISHFNKISEKVSRHERRAQDLYLKKLLKVIFREEGISSLRQSIVSLGSSDPPLLLDTKIYNPARDSVALQEYYQFYDPRQ